ncbi:GntR family transcriptional regulator [Saccharopolyspora kobensis]|uniref:GntR family transcriptional regulator n=1 Tax=Saccharopolyspora kobensis TaxID=146035 RepID=A0A1H6A6Y3_9PSEU|nr:GntR family transcriptional regulator [Saccharopolyspora kobensis]SEG44488.1 GntR family transcriptional regulator [Saccharopolyspora kobensis]SFE51691.1 GntR family transcriptional regulator [Saccharopolyspora kobensis]
MVTRIDRSSPLPFYYQLKQIVVSDIKRRGMSPGDRLPGDHELCETYDVSRTVVRQALSDLEAEGVVERVKGRGTFVAKPKIAEGLVQSLTGLYADVAARGSSLRSDVRRIEVVPANEQVAAELDLEPGTPVIAIERLRFVDDEPWVFTATHLPHHIAPGLEDEDLSTQSLYTLLEQDYGVRLKRGRRSVEAAKAGAELAADLGIPEGDPVLLLRSTSFGADDRPVEVFVAFHRGDRSRFDVDLESSATAGPNTLMRVTEA